MKDIRKADVLRLEHMIDAICDIQVILLKVSYDEFSEDMTKMKAVAYSLIIIGEAANHLSKLFQFEHPELAYSKMISMRNRIAHEYYQVDYEVVWKIYQEELPKLKEQIEKILEEMRQITNIK